MNNTSSPSRIARLALTLLLLALPTIVSAQDFVIDFTDSSNYWKLPEVDIESTKTYSYNGYTIKIGIDKDENGHFKWSTNSHLYLYGRGSYITLPTFDFEVDSIVVEGRSAASSTVTHNIFVNGVAASTACKGITASCNFRITDKYQSAGTAYTFKITGPNKSSAAQITKIKVYKKIAGQISIASTEGYGTFYTDSAFLMPQGLKGGIVSDIRDSYIYVDWAYPSGSIVPAKTALLVYGAKGEYAYSNSKTTATAPENKYLHGVSNDTTVNWDGAKRYILTYAEIDGKQVLGFYATVSRTMKVSAHRAYLELPLTSQVEGFTFSEGNISAITSPLSEEAARPTAIYTLSGVKLNTPTTANLPSGIYIINGKKVLVR